VIAVSSGVTVAVKPKAASVSGEEVAVSTVVIGAVAIELVVDSCGRDDKASLEAGVAGASLVVNDGSIVLDVSIGAVISTEVIVDESDEMVVGTGVLLIVDISDAVVVGTGILSVVAYVLVITEALSLVVVSDAVVVVVRTGILSVVANVIVVGTEVL
jgi:hypothetical protein